MDPLTLVNLTGVMERARGRADMKIGVIDGPVLMRHPDLTHEHLRDLSGAQRTTCRDADGTACLHGTFVTGILAAKRDSAAPAICPDCTILVRPIFGDTGPATVTMPGAPPQELAAAILECMQAGARVINLSLALTAPSATGARQLEEALDEATKRGVVVVAAAGNEGTLGSSIITRHPGVIPVVACNLRGMPISESNLGGTIGRRGLTAPGSAITSLGPNGDSLTLGGTSVAAPFVTGAIALLWSEFFSASPTEIRLAITRTSAARRTSVVPPLLNVAAAYHMLAMREGRPS